MTETIISSATKEVVIGFDRPFVMIGERINPTGRKKLAAEGLFGDDRKQLLPFMPKVVGVITSPTGAVIRDILHRLKDRFPLHVLLWPVRVQGETSGREVANGIRQFNAIEADGPMPRPDVIIVARGGGSLEDLWLSRPYVRAGFTLGKVCTNPLSYGRDTIAAVLCISAISGVITVLVESLVRRTDRWSNFMID